MLPGRFDREKCQSLYHHMNLMLYTVSLVYKLTVADKVGELDYTLVALISSLDLGGPLE